MKIEITDRAEYLKRAEARLERLLASRAKVDAAYEARWRKRIWPFKDRPETAKPPGYSVFYPSILGWGTEIVLRRIISALRSDGTGSVYLNDEEFYYVAKPEVKP